MTTWILREGSKARFRYRRESGAAVRDARTLERIRQLAIPPGWSDVHIAESARASVQAWGLDTSLAFSQNMYVSAFVAQTKTTGRSGRDYSYRTQFSYAADRYGLMVDRIEAQPNFNPELGFMRRMDFREHIVSGRFSPRPAKNKRVRKYFYEGGLTDVADTSGVHQSRATTGSYRVELQNSDLLSVTYSKNYEFLPVPSRTTYAFRWAATTSAACSLRITLGSSASSPDRARSKSGASTTGTRPPRPFEAVPVSRRGSPSSRTSR